MRKMKLEEMLFRIRPEYVGNEEVIFIENNENFVSNLSNSISTLLSNDNLTINEKGLQKVKDFSKEIYYENYFNILNKLKRELIEGELWQN